MNPRDLQARSPLQRESLLSNSFVKLFLGLFFCCVILGIFGLVPYYLELRGASETFYGLAAGMQGVGGVVGMLAFGRMADVHTRRTAALRYFVPALLGSALALPAMSWHPLWYCACLGLLGITGGVGLPVLFVWASELCPPQRRTEAFAWLGIGGLAADSLGPLLGETLLTLQGPVRVPEDFRWVFGAALMLAPLVVVCLMLTPDVRPRADGGAERRGLLVLLSQRSVLASMLAAIPFGGALGILLSLGKNFVASIHLQFVSVLLGGHTVGAVSARLALPWILRRFERSALIVAGFAGIVLSMLVLSITGGYALLLFAGLTYGVSHGILFPTLLSRLIDYGGAHAAGRLSTLYMGMFSLGAGAITFIAGLLLHVAGFRSVFVFAALSCALALGLMRHAERAHGRPHAGER